MYLKFIRENKQLISIIIFIIIFSFIQIIKPECFYNKDGSIREFGIGYKNKTIFPVWLFSLILGILCYLSILYLIIYNN
jgi:uncharacterized membrane protein YozB (DUF420 family)